MYYVAKFIQNVKITWTAINKYFAKISEREQNVADIYIYIYGIKQLKEC